MNSRKTGQVRITSSKITMAMIACGIVGAAFIGAANAATPDDDVARVTVRYNPQSLETESGARALYSQLVNAAAEACPQGPDSPIGSRSRFANAAHRRLPGRCSR